MTCVSASRTLILCMDINRSTSAVDGASPSGLYTAEQQQKHRNRSNRLTKSSESKRCQALGVRAHNVSRPSTEGTNILVVKKRQDRSRAATYLFPVLRLLLSCLQRAHRAETNQDNSFMVETVSHPPATAKLRDKKALKVYGEHVQEDTDAAVKRVPLHRCDTNTPKAR